jgi:formiminotetrahydrofolate cyclodeaminase
MRVDPGAFSIDLDEMARRPLPGAIAAVAVAASMGAALIAKSVHVALRHQELDGPGRAGMVELAGRASRTATDLLDLAGADALAYRSVLDTRAMAAHEPARQRAWLAAAEVPLRLAELSIPLEESIPALFDRCPPVVHFDLQIGASLLHAASEGGWLVAETNLENCGQSDDAGPLRLRLAALKEPQVD